MSLSCGRRIWQGIHSSKPISRNSFSQRFSFCYTDSQDVLKPQKLVALGIEIIQRRHSRKLGQRRKKTWLKLGPLYLVRKSTSEKRREKLERLMPCLWKTWCCLYSVTFDYLVRPPSLRKPSLHPGVLRYSHPMSSHPDICCFSLLLTNCHVEVFILFSRITIKSPITIFF